MYNHTLLWLQLSIVCFDLPHISVPQTTEPSYLQVHTLQSSPAGMSVSPTAYSVPWYVHTAIECEALFHRLKECNIKVWKNSFLF